jgi:heme oxygenase
MMLARLRHETATLHQDVERQVDLLSPTLTPERYIRILRAFQAFFLPWEAALEADCPASLAGRPTKERSADTGS